MAGACAIEGLGLAELIQARFAKAGVGAEIVAPEIEAVLDERGARKRVVAYTITAHPRIQEREREQEKQEQPALVHTAAQRQRKSRRTGFHKAQHAWHRLYDAQTSGNSETWSWSRWRLHKCAHRSSLAKQNTSECSLSYI